MPEEHQETAAPPPARRRRPMLLTSLRTKAALVAVALVLALVAITGYIVIRHERFALTREVELRVLAQARSVAASSERVMLEPDPELTFQKLLREIMSRDADIESVVIVDQNNIVLAHPQVTKIRTRYTGERGLTPVRDVKQMDAGETLAEGGNGFVVSTPITRTYEGQVLGIGRVYIRSSNGKVVKTLADARNQILVIALLVSVAGSVCAVLLSGLITAPIKQLAAGARRIGEGDLAVRVPVKSRDELGELSATLNEMAGRLAAARAELVGKERIARELEIAREIQQTLLPHALPDVELVDVAAVCESATEVGGDYFDLITLDHKRIGVCVADVAGKGVPGLLVMGVARTVLRAQARAHLSPREVLIRANDIISPDIRRGMFVTVLYGVLDVERRIFTFANAGHNPLIIVKKEGREPYEVIKTQGRPVGFMVGPFFDDRLEEHTFLLEEGDTIVAYTDGVLDAYGDGEEQFGMDRFLETLTAKRGAPSQEIVNEVLARLADFVGNRPQQDDITILAVALRSAHAQQEVPPGAEETAAAPAEQTVAAAEETADSPG